MSNSKMNVGDEALGLLKWQIQQGAKRYVTALRWNIQANPAMLFEGERLTKRADNLRRLTWRKKMNIDVSREDAALLVKILRLGYKQLETETLISLQTYGGGSVKLEVSTDVLEKALRVSATVITQLTLGIGNEEG